jgi:hypothetical protein
VQAQQIKVMQAVKVTNPRKRLAAAVQELSALTEFQQVMAAMVSQLPSQDHQ